MRKALLFLSFLFLLSCRQESIGPLNGVMVVYSPDLAEFIDGGGLEDLHLVVETVDPEQVLSFSYADLQEFTGTLRERRIVLMLLSPEDQGEIPGDLEETSSGIYSGRDIWALNQHVFAVVVNGGGIPEELPAVIEEAYDQQMHAYLYRSFVSTSMTSQARIDSLRSLGFSMDVPKSYETRKWTAEDGFVQYQRQPDEECMLLLSINVIDGFSQTELTPENAMLAREAMARTWFFDASEDSVDRARTTFEPVVSGGLSGIQLTGVWRNPEYLNAGSFTSRVLDAGDEWYILDLEVYNPGHAKEPYLREGWIIMDTFVKE